MEPIISHQVSGWRDSTSSPRPAPHIQYIVHPYRVMYQYRGTRTCSIHTVHCTAPPASVLYIIHCTGPPGSVPYTTYPVKAHWTLHIPSTVHCTVPPGPVPDILHTYSLNRHCTIHIIHCAGPPGSVPYIPYSH
jgi:hypothetical protein